MDLTGYKIRWTVTWFGVLCDSLDCNWLPSCRKPIISTRY